MASTADEKVAIRSVVSLLHRTLLMSLHPFEMKHIRKGKVLSKTEKIISMATFNFKILIRRKNYTVEWDFTLQYLPAERFQYIQSEYW